MPIADWYSRGVEDGLIAITYYTNLTDPINGKRYFCFFSQPDNTNDPYTGWVMALPGHEIVSFICEPTIESAKLFAETVLLEIENDARTDQ